MHLYIKVFNMGGGVGLSNMSYEHVTEASRSSACARRSRGPELEG